MPRPHVAHHSIPAFQLGVMMFVVATVVAGCATGSSSSAPSNPPATGPGAAAGTVCDLITVDQAVKATGGLNVVEAIPLTDASGCSYEVADGSAILAFELVDAAYWAGFAAGPHLKLKLGDESIWFADNGLLVVLVRDGGDRFAVTVQVPRGSPKPALEVAKSMAGYLLARA